MKFFENGLPLFWDEDAKLNSQENGNNLIFQGHMDHSKFEYMTKGIT